MCLGVRMVVFSVNYCVNYRVATHTYQKNRSVLYRTYLVRMIPRLRSSCPRWTVAVTLIVENYTYLFIYFI
jgi:hypothetical protein